MLEAKTKQTFELSEEDTMQAIQDWIEKKHGKNNEIRVDISVKTITTGFGYSEHTRYEVIVKAERDA